MKGERDGRDKSTLRFARRLVWAVAIFLGLRGSALAAGLVSADYQLDWDQDVNKTATQKNDTWTYKHILDMKYSGFLSPIVENEIKLKIEQEVKSDADPKSTTRIFPTINLSFKGSYWNAGAKRTIEDSNEPNKNANISDSYFVEFLFVPPRSTLPDLKAKYTLDQDYESGATDTNDQEVVLSSAYRPKKWVEFKGDYKRHVKDDNRNPDSDTEEETYSGTVGIRHFISEKIRVTSEFRTESNRRATLLDSGGATNQQEEQKHTWKNSMALRPFRYTNIDGSYDFDLQQKMYNGEHRYAKNWKATVTQKVVLFDLKGDFSRAINEVRHTTDDYEKTQDTWLMEGKARFSKHLDFTFKYQKQYTDEIHIQDPTKNIQSESILRSATWSGEITSFWKGYASYDKTDTFEDGMTTTVETKYSLKSTFDFKAIKLLLEPIYDVNCLEDRQLTPVQETETRDFRFRIDWEAFHTNNMVAKVAHTYGRTTDSNAMTIQRTDESTGNLTWNNPLPGWNVGFDFTRSASDTSQDDQPPEITSTFGFKVDYNHKNFKWDMSYKYDKKRLTDDSETFDFKIGWVATRWDVSLTYSFDKTFSEELSEAYSIGLVFKLAI